MKKTMVLTLTISFQEDISGQEQDILDNVCYALQTENKQIGLNEEENLYASKIEASEVNGEAYNSITC